MSAFYEAYRVEGLLGEESNASKNDFPTLMLAPLGSAIPNDGLLTYVTFDNAVDLLAHAKDPAGKVILVREDQADVVRILCSNADVFEIDFVTMYGVPESDYRPWFDEATFSTERLSYSPFVEEIRVASDVAAVQEANRPKTTLEKEESTYVRSTGRVKSIDPALMSVGDDDDDSVESGDH